MVTKYFSQRWNPTGIMDNNVERKTETALELELAEEDARQENPREDHRTEKWRLADYQRFHLE